MIKFFRKIRQNLLMENKTGKYFKYAIGEIVLVVIGILIAVQINSSVGTKQLKKGNKVFLNKMLTELELNKERMQVLTYGDTLKENRRYLSLDEAIKNSNELLNRTYKGLTANDFDFIINKRMSAGGSYLNLHNGIYEELINTGKLYTLGSDNLITEIKNYYKRCEREDLYNIGNTKNMYEGFDLLKNGLSKMKLDFYKDSANFNLTNYPWFYDKHSPIYQNMQIGISEIIGGQSSNFYKMNEITKYSDSLIFVINKELKTYHD